MGCHVIIISLEAIGQDLVWHTDNISCECNKECIWWILWLLTTCCLLVDNWFCHQKSIDVFMFSRSKTGLSQVSKESFGRVNIRVRCAKPSGSKLSKGNKENPNWLTLKYTCVNMCQQELYKFMKNKQNIIVEWHLTTIYGINCSVPVGSQYTYWMFSEEE